MFIIVRMYCVSGDFNVVSISSSSFFLSIDFNAFVFVWLEFFLLFLSLFHISLH